MRDVKPKRLLLVAAVAVVLGLSFQGSRGLWEPDEGRNVNIALGMLSGSDWMIPRLNGDIYLDKPPLHYWSVAAGLCLLGSNEWAARLPQAFFFLVTVALTGAFAARLWDRATGELAALVYATTLIPFAAANVLTPDTPLAAFLVLLYYAYWRAETDSGRLARWRWWLVAGGAAGLGLLTKGPAVLVFLPPLFLHLVWRRRLGTVLRQPGAWTAAAVALLLGAVWYVPVVRGLPGAADYLFHNQVSGRLIHSDYRRHPGWRGAVEVYLPVLTLGALPWSGWWLLRGARFLRLRELTRSPARLLIVLWIGLPLLVFLLASSRLPLYLLPLFAPFALATGRALALAAGAARGWRSRAAIAMALWCLLLLGIKGGAAWRGAHRDARLRAEWLRAQVPTGGQLVAVDLHMNGMRLYGYDPLLWVTSIPDPYPLFSPLATLDQAATALAAGGGREPSLVVVPEKKVAPIRRRLESAGLVCDPGRPGDRVALLICAPALPAPAAPAGGGG